MQDQINYSFGFTFGLFMFSYVNFLYFPFSLLIGILADVVLNDLLACGPFSRARSMGREYTMRQEWDETRARLAPAHFRPYRLLRSYSRMQTLFGLQQKIPTVSGLLLLFLFYRSLSRLRHMKGFRRIDEPLTSQTESTTLNRFIIHYAPDPTHYTNRQWTTRQNKHVHFSLNVFVSILARQTNKLLLLRD